MARAFNGLVHDERFVKSHAARAAAARATLKPVAGARGLVAREEFASGAVFNDWLHGLLAFRFLDRGAGDAAWAIITASRSIFWGNGRIINTSAVATTHNLGRWMENHVGLIAKQVYQGVQKFRRGGPQSGDRFHFFRDLTVIAQIMRIGGPNGSMPWAIGSPDDEAFAAIEVWVLIDLPGSGKVFEIHNKSPPKKKKIKSERSERYKNFSAPCQTFDTCQSFNRRPSNNR
jgi:hypothetical protein